jgi:hypothetical protein
MVADFVYAAHLEDHEVFEKCIDWALKHTRFLPDPKLLAAPENAMREAKRADELEAMIMQELRKHPDWGHVLSVSVEPSGQQAPHPNWRAAFVADGERSTPGAAIQFAEILGAKYDLA